jgi:L-malate glycosyltransferase
MNLVVHALLRAGLVLYHGVLSIARALGPKPRQADATGCHVLLTGTFKSEAWVEHHLRPLAASTECRKVTIVATNPVPSLAKVSVVAPPRWLTACLGSAGSRLVVFALAAFRERPHIVGGFHLLFNGLAAALVAPLVGARSMYVCVGGPAEVLDGGILAENKLFNALRTPDALIEHLLVRAVRTFDLIITMGSGARSFLRDRGVNGEIHVIPGGLDLALYKPSTDPPATDVVFVGRLAPIKRPELLLDAIAAARARLGRMSALIVGDGPLRAALEDHARTSGLGDAVTFTGHRNDAVDLLARSRVFVLTSQSEGVSLSLMEALACGVPAVVAHVGDLADVLADGVNGYLVDSHDPQKFADRLVQLLSNEALRHRFAEAARLRANAYGVEAITRRWESVLRPLQTSRAVVGVETPVARHSAGSARDNSRSMPTRTL